MCFVFLQADYYIKICFHAGTISNNDDESRLWLKKLFTITVQFNHSFYEIFPVPKESKNTHVADVKNLIIYILKRRSGEKRNVSSDTTNALSFISEKKDGRKWKEGEINFFSLLEEFLNTVTIELKKQRQHKWIDKPLDDPSGLVV